MTAYYNEIDPKAAQWLRNLIDAGHIAPGIVDERSIEDVYPSDLRGFTQCHFFAGIGVWSHALRQAGWTDDRPVWTGSCPCQPFSAAGKGAGFDDERHLWPAFHHLIKECSPAIVFGEQVASKYADAWIDLVHTDLEALGYAFGAIPFPSAGVGAPHIRDRLYWLADARKHHRGPQAASADHGQPQANRSADWVGGCGGVSGILGNAGSAGLAQCIGVIGIPGGASGGNEGQATERAGIHIGGMADTIMQQRPNGERVIGDVNDAGGRLESAAAPAGLCARAAGPPRPPARCPPPPPPAWRAVRPRREACAP